MTLRCLLGHNWVRLSIQYVREPDHDRWHVKSICPRCGAERAKVWIGGLLGMDADLLADGLEQLRNWRAA